MESWSDYIIKLLNTKGHFDDVQITLAGDQPSFTIPPVIKASILMLDKFQSGGSNKNIFVMPENDQLIFLFAIIKTIHNILNGKIGRDYNPEQIPIGTRLKLGNAVVEFKGLEIINKEEYVTVYGNDGKLSFKKWMMPYFQQTDSQRLSKIDDFKTELHKSGKTRGISADSNCEWLQTLQDYKTHLDNSVYYVAPIVRTKKLFSQCVIGNCKLNDLLLLGHVDYEGNLINIGPGKLAGIPAITLCNDLSSINAASEQGNPVQSVIINISNDNILNNDLSFLDELLKLGKPVLGLCSTVNSTHLDDLKKRGFNIWRWNENTLIPELFCNQNTDIGHKVKNAANNQISYAQMIEDPYSDDLERMDRHKKFVQTSSINIQRIEKDIYLLLIQEIRGVADVPADIINSSLQKIDSDLKSIDNEKKYISPEMYEDFHDVLIHIQNRFSENTDNPKIRYLKNYIEQKQPIIISILVPDKDDCNKISKFWKNWCNKKNIATTVNVETVSEFISSEDNLSQMVFICGWMRKDLTVKLLYSFNSARYTILLYHCEEKWQRYGTYSILKGLDDSCNQELLKYLTVDSEISVTTEHVEPLESEENQENQGNDIESIDHIITQYKIHHYAGSSSTSQDGLVKAVPVTYIGDYMAFYRSGHSIICATRLIEGIKDDIDRIHVDNLRVGDFVVVSGVEHDLTKEMGDRILRESGNEDKIKLASKWRESIKVERMFSEDEEIIKKFQKAGIKRNKLTFENWLYDTELIAPSTKQDIIDIAKAFKDNVLMEMSDDIFKAAEYVRSARKSAGRILSEELRKEIAGQLEKMGEIDPVNIWDPIRMNVDGFGKIMILKVIDISPEIEIDSARTDRLLRDEE